MTTPSPTPRSMIVALGALSTAAALMTDLASKWWALDALSDGHRVPLLGQWLCLRLVFNPGAAFSLGDNFTLLLTGVAAIISVVLIVAIWRARSTLNASILGMLLGGALGNLYDRLTQPPGLGRGHVVDFIDYNGWFVGNVADIWIVCAAAALVVIASRTPHLADTATPAETMKKTETSETLEGPETSETEEAHHA